VGKLQEQTIPTLFNGISKQPHSVRFTGQVDDAQNVTFSVETGGFSKRLGTRLVKKLSLPTNKKYRLHIINRDANEKYYAIVGNNSIKVFDKDFVEKTVTLATGAAAFLTGDPDDFALLTNLDYTFIVNKSLTVTMDPASAAPAAPNIATLFFRIGFSGRAGDVFKVWIDGTEKASHVAGDDQDASEVASRVQTRLIENLGVGWQVTRTGSYIHIRKTDGSSFTITQQSPQGDTGIHVRKGIISDSTELPAKALHGMVLNISGVSGEGFWVKFIADNSVSGDGRWRETVGPGNLTEFDGDTMPWGLVRQANGTFHLGPLEWGPKIAGGDVEVPSPDFVGGTISDLVSVRNRLGIVSGETVYFSAVGDVFNFWPESSTELLDSDPFGVSNTTNSVSSFAFAIPFRRSVFVMADNAQFEIGGELFTPSRAAIDLATSYTASTRCRPVAVGDELYFPAEVGRVSTLLSYAYSESSVSETAYDVTKHVRGLIPSPLIELTGDTVNSQVFALSETTPDTIYVHTFFYQGQERVQSAWGRYRMAGHAIHSIGLLEGVLVILSEFDGDIHLSQLPTQGDIYNDFSWIPRIDNHKMITGTYDANDHVTTWDMEYDITDPVVVTSNLFPEGQRMMKLTATVEDGVVSVVGDWSAHPVAIGQNFDSYVELSKQYLRDPQGNTLINGRLQIRNMTFRYSDTGYFVVDVMPEGRDSRRWVFSGRTLGSGENLTQKFPISSGKFRFGVNTNGETVGIRISSDSFLPFTITSAAWVGFFNEISRQG
jgi:hypothetical protein